MKWIQWSKDDDIMGPATVYWVRVYLLSYVLDVQVYHQ